MNRAEKRRNKKLADNGAKKTRPIHESSSIPAKQEQTLAIQQAIDLAVQHHKAGDLPKAEAIYQQILQTDPNQPVALHLLGVIVHQAGKNNIAVDLITKAIAINPDYVGAHSNLGNALKALGRLDEAVVSYSKAITINPDLFEVHSSLGVVLKVLGRLDEAISSYQKALAIKPDYAEAHNNLGNALYDQGKFDEAMGSFDRATNIKPNYAEAHSNLGNAFQELGQLDEAAASYNDAISIKPDYAEAHSNLGAALQKLEQFDEAVASYNKALNIKPDYAEAHNNLGIALQEIGKQSEAITHHRRAIKLNPEINIFWSGLADSLRSFSFTTVDDDLLHDLLSLVDQPAVRPIEIVQPVFSALGQHVEFSKTLTLAESLKPDTSRDFQLTALKLSATPLFLRLITLTHVPNLKIERMLTHLRSLMLQETIAGNMKDDGLPFASALALHCFTNEYVFAVTDEEILSVEHLQKQISELVEQKQDVPPSSIVTLGAYSPLHKFDWAQGLAEREWGKEVHAVIERQISEPFMELSLRSELPCLTPVQDTVSRSVRDQYEENPYPRWVKSGLVEKRKSIGAVLKAAPFRFDLGDYETPNSPEILIAGCGTGQHSIYTASRFKDAQVLAVDLSLSSLAYAVRKTDELGVANIEYAQADIMELGMLDRQFDIIECAGVLHHLGDPMAGWKVLVDLLKPGGLMRVGLYSEIARQHIVTGRSVISEMGYTTSPEDIRQCRQDFIATADDGNAVMTKICNGQDFFSLSTCRDSLFHVQEHRFTIPQIVDALDNLNLKFLGFELKDQTPMKRFKEIYPKKNDLTSLVLWHKYEQQHPNTFNSMYQFWCQKS